MSRRIPHARIFSRAMPEETASADSFTREKSEPEFDLDSLPPIESIGVGTDIRAFLQKGVPLELTRAALRRAWTSDPAIRDFIGIAENQWDFATGSDIPGFGPLDLSDDVRRMVAELVHENVSAPHPPIEGDSQPMPDKQNLEMSVEVAARPESAKAEMPIGNQLDAGTDAARRSNNIASQQDEQTERAPAKRSHGRALPQ